MPLLYKRQHTPGETHEGYFYLEPLCADGREGFKIFETRTWKPPQSVIGQRIAIASTKAIRPKFIRLFEDNDFRVFYERLIMPGAIVDMKNGYVLGTVIVDSVELMTLEFMDDVSNEEQMYGYWEEGNYAWRLRDPVELPEPIPARGAQGFWEWNNELPVNKLRIIS